MLNAYYPHNIVNYLGVLSANIRPQILIIY